LAAVLEKKGHNVDVIDLQGDDPSTKELEAELQLLHPDIVGVTSATLTFNPAIQIIKAAKRVLPSCLTLMGGPHVTVMDEETLNANPDTDVVVRGEGEQTILELAQLVSETRLDNLGGVAGITFRKKTGQVVRNSQRPFIEDLDTLPYPAHEHFDVRRYKVSGKTYLPIITSRGCPFQCAFCLASHMCGKGFRARRPKNVVDELEWLKDTYGAEAFAFYDDTFTYDNRRAFAICEEMRNRKFNLPWDCRTRVDRVTPELLTTLRKTNCLLIHFGVESGSQKMLNAMRKGTTVEQNASAIKWAKEAGISVAISVVVGYPGETPEMMEETFEFIRKTEPDYLYMCEAVPYPGTEMYNVVKKLGWQMSEDWSQFHEQTQVFKNPLLPLEMIERKKKAFYDEFFSPAYFLRKRMKKDFYSQTMARMAMNHLYWRIKIPKWISGNFRRLGPSRGSQGGHSKSTMDEEG
jgi:radical SAM superfamily enzyme YgiQ (UPF0313 family)